MAHSMWRWRAAVFVTGILAGASFVAVGVTARGTDLRPAGGDISSVIEDRSASAKAKQQTAADLQAQIDRLLAEPSNSATVSKLQMTIADVSPAAGFTAVAGQGVRVELTDAPNDVNPDGVDPNFLVVHQQDIQAFVNALWAGGAQAVTLQGVRLISTTGIRCVGNTVVLDGVPYSPPYVIEAVGRPGQLLAALDASPEVTIYRQWSDRYELGLKTAILDSVTAPAYQGSVDLQYATAH